MDLKSYLREKNESVASFAERAEVSRQTVYSLVAGKSKPTIDLAQTIDELTEGMVPLKSWARKAAKR